MTTTVEAKPEAATLSKDEIQRYSRHLIMPEVGMDGQQKLKAARVLCVGTGGLGSPMALYLAAAGVGTLGIVDFDVVPRISEPGVSDELRLALVADGIIEDVRSRPAESQGTAATRTKYEHVHETLLIRHSSESPVRDPAAGHHSPASHTSCFCPLSGWNRLAKGHANRGGLSPAAASHTCHPAQAIASKGKAWPPRLRPLRVQQK